ncbi:MAG: M23 family metallopeptidase [Rhodobacteraceae bacterium]|nr:M23 family metallopeptidase [Paracoccaceae bacterium]MBR9819436.1 M23 family metallopeptidase [Paracoccaceae bacterium]
MRIEQMTGQRRSPARLLAATCLVALVAGCTFDSDLRGGLDAFSTADAARSAAAPRPQPDNRGIISYPNYQVAVARRDDRVANVAQRIGADPAALARYNGLEVDSLLREGEVLALPSRVAEPSPATGAAGTGPIVSPGQVDIASMAGSAIDRAAGNEVAVATLPPAAPGEPTRQVGNEPIRHQVRRGETAYTIARTYGVSVRALSDWNGLDSQFTIREGQFLLIPLVAENGQASAAPAPVEAPGSGSATPVPPSASQPLPEEQPLSQSAAQAQAQEDKQDLAPDLSSEQSQASTRFDYPLRGRIIREYEKGRSDGIDLAADPGTAVKAAGSGSVAAIIEDTDSRAVIVIKHDDNLLTLYSNVSSISVAKGDSVSRGQKIAQVPGGSDAYLHFEVRRGLDTVNPMDYLP